MSPREAAMSITDFLLARVAEDEQRVDTIPDWYCTDSARGEGWGSRGSECNLCERYMFDGTEAGTAQDWWDHREGPADQRSCVLADCAAKRRLIELHHADDGSGGWAGYCVTCGNDTGPDPFPCDTIRALAAPYSDHPDYQQEWAS